MTHTIYQAVISAHNMDLVAAAKRYNQQAAEEAIAAVCEDWDAGLSFIETDLMSFAPLARSADTTEEIAAAVDSLTSALGSIVADGWVSALDRDTARSICNGLSDLGNIALHCGVSLNSYEIISRWNKMHSDLEPLAMAPRYDF